MEFNNEFKDFLAWEAISRERVDVKAIYIDMAGGDHAAGILLSQLVYWYMIPARDGKSKLRVSHDGKMWIAKGRDEWYSEVRITGRQFDRVAKLLESSGIIEKKVYKFAGAPRVHIRIVVENFLEKWHTLVGKASKSIEKPPVVKKKVKKQTEEQLGPTCSKCHQQGSVVETLYDSHSRCAWCLILDGWTYYLHDKQADKDRRRSIPRRTSTDQSRKLRTKANARWKDDDFKILWRPVLERCSLSGHLTSSNWFTLEYFLRDDANWRDINDGKFDSFDKQHYPLDYARLQQWLAGKQAGIESKSAGWSQI